MIKWQNFGLGYLILRCFGNSSNLLPRAHVFLPSKRNLPLPSYDIRATRFTSTQDITHLAQHFFYFTRIQAGSYITISLPSHHAWNVGRAVTIFLLSKLGLPSIPEFQALARRMKRKERRSTPRSRSDMSSALGKFSEFKL